MNAQYMVLMSLLLVPVCASAEMSAFTTASIAIAPADFDSVLDSAVLHLSMFVAGWLMFSSVKHKWMKPLPKEACYGSPPSRTSSPRSEADHGAFHDPCYGRKGLAQQANTTTVGDDCPDELQLTDALALTKGGPRSQTPSTDASPYDSLATRLSTALCALTAELEEAELGFPPSRSSSPWEGSSPVHEVASAKGDSEAVAVVAGFAKVLEQKVQMVGAADIKLPPWRRSCFHARQVSCEEPELELFVTKLHWYFECSSAAFVIALVYLERVLRTHPDLPFTDVTCHRLVLACLVVALKYQDDEYPFKNSWYAEIGDLHVQVLNEMEAQLCKMLGWKLFVQAEEYERCYQLITSL